MKVPWVRSATIQQSIITLALSIGLMKSSNKSQVTKLSNYLVFRVFWKMRGMEKKESILSDSSGENSTSRAVARFTVAWDVFDPCWRC